MSCTERLNLIYLPMPLFDFVFTCNILYLSDLKILLSLNSSTINTLYPFLYNELAIFKHLASNLKLPRSAITTFLLKRKSSYCAKIVCNKFKNRFWYYDVLFLDVLVNSKGRGSRVFSDLFRNNDPLLLFKFLGEKTNILEEIRIFISVNTMTFVKSLVKRVKSVYLKESLKN